MQEFSDDLLIRVAKVHRPGYDHYVMLRDEYSNLPSARGRRIFVGLIKGNEIIETWPTGTLIELYTSRKIDMDAVRRLARKKEVEEGSSASAIDRLQEECGNLCEKYGAEDASIQLGFENRIMSASSGMTIKGVRDMLCTAIYHLEKAARGELTI